MPASHTDALVDFLARELLRAAAETAGGAHSLAGLPACGGQAKNASGPRGLEKHAHLQGQTCRTLAFQLSVQGGRVYTDADAHYELD